MSSVSTYPDDDTGDHVLLWIAEEDPLTETCYSFIYPFFSIFIKMIKSNF